MMKVWVDDRATRRRVGDLLVRREGLWVVIVGDGQWESDSTNVIGVCGRAGSSIRNLHPHGTTRVRGL